MRLNNPDPAAQGQRADIDAPAADLAEVVAAWPRLDSSARADVLALIRAAEPKNP